ncbi:MAG: type 4b pilus protein PilO2 [Alphaproteobacteria bacterium]|nr:type 4b pilus protein PilO2 [Alphaproteobacteria bacterium]
MDDTQTEEKAWKATFNCGGTTYAASLFWQPLLNEDKPLPEVKEAAENIMEGADLYVTRKGKSAQFGLAASSQGFTKGLPSAAIALISGLGNVTSFLGVFKVDTGWWYICYRNDVILSDGDTLFISERDAKNQFISMLAVPDWDAIFAPAEWAIEETKSAEIEPLLNRGLQVKLDKIDASNDTIMLAVIVVCFAIILWFAYSTLKDLFFSAPSAPIIAPIEQAEQAELPPEPKPWEDLNNPVDVMRSCYAGVQKVVQVVTPGWVLGQIACNPNSGIVTSWTRVHGRLTWIEQALDVSGVEFTSRALGKDGNEIIVTTPIEKPKTFNSPPEYTEDDLINTINDINQALDLQQFNSQIMLNPISWVSPRGTKYQLLEFTITSNNDPLEWIGLLMKFSGLSIKSIIYNIHSNDAKWTYKGEIYEL